MTEQKIPRRVMRAFAAVVLVSFAVLAVQAWQIEKTRHIAHENATLIKKVAADHATIGQLHKAQAESCANFNTMRGAVNDFHGTIRALLVKLRNTDLARSKTIRDPKLKAVDRASVKALDRILAHTHLVTAICAQKKNPASSTS